MSRMMKAVAYLAAQALESGCVILHVIEARAGGRDNQSCNLSIIQ